MHKFYKLFFVGFLFSTVVTQPLTAQGKLFERMEPPNWYVGFEQTEFQLLLYGPNISELDVTLDDEDVKLLSVTRTENDNYLFLKFNVLPNATAGEIELRFTDRLGEVITLPYSLEERQHREIEGFGQSDVIYLITPDRFANGDPGNDSVEGMREMAVDRADPGGRHGGDLAGIREHLNYFEQLGVTALWLNPVVENDMPKYSYHGYAITDAYRVDPRYGSNVEYRDLCAELRRRGIKMIQDVVPNHVGSEHWFVKDPPSPDWINYGGVFERTNHQRTTVQDIHASEYDRRRFADGWFVKTMPDLNQRNELMSTYLLQNALWWIEYAGLGGLRVDTYPYSDKTFLEEWTNGILREYPSMSIVGEEMSAHPAIVSYWQKGKVNHDGYVGAVPQLMDFPLEIVLGETLTEGERYDSGFVKLYETLAMDFLYPAPEELVVLADNHDVDRIMTKVGDDVRSWEMALAFVLTTRGIPQIFYGTEVLLDNSDHPGSHGHIRADMPGGWMGDEANAFSGEGLSEDRRAAFDWLSKLLHWRKTARVVHEGKLIQFAPKYDGVYVFSRVLGDARTLTVLNKNDGPAALDTEQLTEVLGKATYLRNVVNGERLRIEPGMTVPRRGGFVFQVE